MTGLWLEDRKLNVRKLQVPSPAPDEALVRLRLAGICGTDLELARGYYPYAGVPGHEFVGEVVEALSEPSWVGRRVVGEINASCKECDTCLAGRPTHCERRTVLGIVNHDGVFAEYFTLPVGNLHKIPSSLPDEAAVFTEPLAAACQILEQVTVERGYRVLLIGAGRLGQLIARVLSLSECELHVIARYPIQEELLHSHGIATIVPEEISNRSFDVVVEATGDPSGFKLAVQAVRPRGTIVLKSTYHGKIEVDFSALVVDEVALVGSRCGPFAKALTLMERSRIDPTYLIAKTYPLDQSLQAFEHAAEHGALKVLLDPRLE
ncbi:MAG: alcohol dehydrogenase catalytic domain-containing protein [Deltaproteobacteria bacterium]|nr:alcohol dehydrogenase catalytic domain-containing protein [Deltaproteobacteria bacterium]